MLGEKCRGNLNVRKEMLIILENGCIRSSEITVFRIWLPSFCSLEENQPSWPWNFCLCSFWVFPYPSLNCWFGFFSSLILWLCKMPTWMSFTLDDFFSCPEVTICYTLSHFYLIFKVLWKESFFIFSGTSERNSKLNLVLNKKADRFEDKFFLLLFSFADFVL